MALFKKDMPDDAIIQEIPQAPVEVPTLKKKDDFVKCTTNGIYYSITYSKKGETVTESFREPDYILLLPREFAEKLCEMRNPVKMV